MNPLQVCEHKDCDYEPHQELVGGIATWYCCKKGFFKALEVFSKHYANQYKCHICDDKGTIDFRGMEMACPAGCQLEK